MKKKKSSPQRILSFFIGTLTWEVSYLRSKNLYSFFDITKLPHPTASTDSEYVFVFYKKNHFPQIPVVRRKNLGNPKEGDRSLGAIFNMGLWKRWEEVREIDYVPQLCCIRFFKSLSLTNKKKVASFGDVDVNKIGTIYHQAYTNLKV
jgi:hypothetical protein